MLLKLHHFFEITNSRHELLLKYNENVIFRTQNLKMKYIFSHIVGTFKMKQILLDIYFL